MEMVKTNGFTELSVAEMESVDGGFAILVAIGAKTFIITGAMMAKAVGFAFAAGGTGYQIYNAFKN